MATVFLSHLETGEEGEPGVPVLPPGEEGKEGEEVEEGEEEEGASSSRALKSTPKATVPTTCRTQVRRCCWLA